MEEVILGSGTSDPRLVCCGLGRGGPGAELSIQKKGSSQVRYSCTDPATGLVANATRTVAVLDMTPPDVRLLGAAELTVPHAGELADPGAVCADKVDGNLTAYKFYSSTPTLRVNEPQNTEWYSSTPCSCAHIKWITLKTLSSLRRSRLTGSLSPLGWHFSLPEYGAVHWALCAHPRAPPGERAVSASAQELPRNSCVH